MISSATLAARAAFLIALCFLVDPNLVHAQSIPSPWSSTDVGSPQLAGSSRFSNGTFSIDAAGDDIWNTSDQFHFVYRPVAGDVDIIARVDSFSATHWWAKVGVMIRGSLAADAPHAYALVSSENGVAFQRRLTAGAESASTAGPWVTAPYWVRLVRAGTRVTSYSSRDAMRWDLIESATIALGQTAYVGIAVTSHEPALRASANVSGVSVTLAGADPAPTAPSEPAAPSLASADIGAPAIAGSTSLAAGTYTIRAAGIDLWGTSDQFHYAYTQITGDAEVVARVASLALTNEWARAGVMIRESLAANSRYAMTLTTGSRGHGFQRRIDNGGFSEVGHTGSGTAPVWVKLVRSGSLFQAYRSADGKTWTSMGSDSIPMNATVYVGLAVSSRNRTTPTTAVVDNLRVAGAAAGTQPAPTPVPAPTPTPSPTPVPDASIPPRAVVFAASADHATLVTRYVLEIYSSGATPGSSSPVVTSDLGKPTPAVNGEITVDRSAMFQALAPGNYIATVSAVGTAGSSRSLTASFTR